MLIGRTNQSRGGFEQTDERAHKRLQQALGARELGELASAFGFSYSQSSRVCPDEGEPILGVIASEYARCSLVQPMRYDAFIAGLSAAAPCLNRVNTNSVVLDVGSGTGLLGLEIAKAFSEVTVWGVDLSPDMIGIATEFLRKASSDVRSRVHFVGGSLYETETIMSAQAIPRPDVIFSRHVLQRLYRPQAAFEQLAKVIKPGGVIYVTAFCGDLSSGETRAQLVESVQRRLLSPTGEVFWNFAKCYLSAVLRAPKLEEYRALLRVIGTDVKNVSIESDSYECRVRITA